MARRRAFTLFELILGMALLAVLMMFLASMLNSCQTLWRQVTGSSDASAELRKVTTFLKRDVEIASTKMGVADVPASLGGGGKDGCAVWFLSAQSAVNGTFTRKRSGLPYWQRNVLYYCVVPNNHAQAFGSSCTGGVGPAGYDDRCPHKVLIRKVIDFGPVTNDSPTNESNEEDLMTPAQIAPYLTRPSGYVTGAMLSETGVGQVQVRAKHLLYFRVTNAPLPVQAEVRAANIPRANKTIAVGTAPLYNSPVTRESRIVLIPENP